MIKTVGTTHFGVSDKAALPPIESMVEIPADITEVSVRPLSTQKLNESQLCGTKRKHVCTYNEDCASLPSLELEDELSELDDSLSSESDMEAESHGACKRKRRKKFNDSPTTSELIVVLDMDQCLIHMQDEEETKGVVCAKNRKNEEEETDSNHDPLFLNAHNSKILLRPGVVSFLKFVTERFQTHIFTAGSEDYADPILDQLGALVRGDEDNDGNSIATANRDIFCKRWYRDDCDTIEIMEDNFCVISQYVKPLSKIALWAGREEDDLRRIVIIDDKSSNFLLNLGNGIKVPEWKGDRNDLALSTVTQMLKEMDKEGFGDVRPLLRENNYTALKDWIDIMKSLPYRRIKGIKEFVL